MSMQSTTAARRNSAPDATPVKAKAPTVLVYHQPQHSTAGQVRFSASTTKLGSGAYGAVLLGKDEHTSAAVAIKFIPDGRMRASSLDREVSMLQKLSDTGHPSLVKFHGHLPPSAVKAGEIRAEGPLPLPKPHTTCHALVMEAAKGGELFDHVVKCEGLKEVEAAPLYAQMCDAVRTAHGLGIAHRDLKLENVLLVRKKNLPSGSTTSLTPRSAIKLIDWGLAHQHALRANGSVAPEKLHSRCGSRSYMAPEVTNRDISGTVGYDGFAADMWSLGVCLFAMHLAFFPFEQANPDLDWRARRVVDAQRAGKSTMATILSFYPQKAANGGLSAPLIALLDRLLVFNPSKRATMAEVLESEWLAPHAYAACSLSQPTLAQPIRLGATRTHTQSSSIGSEGPLTPRAIDEQPLRDMTSRCSSVTRCSSISSRATERQDSGSTCAATSSSVASSVASSGQQQLPSLPYHSGDYAGRVAAAAAAWPRAVLSLLPADDSHETPLPPLTPMRKKAPADTQLQVVVAGGASAHRAVPGHAQRSPKHGRDKMREINDLLKACKVSDLGSPRWPARGHETEV